MVPDPQTLGVNASATPSPVGGFEPTATLPVLKLRAEILHAVREFFRSHGYWEVETPLLSQDVCVDAWLEPFRVHRDGMTGAGEMFLQTSPEFGMKRLLAAGADSIFQITRAFRQEETGRLHNPEFTIVEWYRVGDSYQQQMDFVQKLVLSVEALLGEESSGLASPGKSVTHAKPKSPLRPLPRTFARLTYTDAFLQTCGESVLSVSTERLSEIAREKGVAPPRSLRIEDRDGWLNLLFLEIVEPMLAEQNAVFISDYPASQAALASIRNDDPPVAERFELYLKGIEICNGYQELTDPLELRERFVIQSQRRASEKRPHLPLESRLHTAMEAGLPSCSGVALGFDRLLMVLLGATSLDEVMAFPFAYA